MVRSHLAAPANTQHGRLAERSIAPGLNPGGDSKSSASSNLAPSSRMNDRQDMEKCLSGQRAHVGNVMVAQAAQEFKSLLLCQTWMRAGVAYRRCFENRWPRKRHGRSNRPASARQKRILPRWLNWIEYLPTKQGCARSIRVRGTNNTRHGS